MCAGSCAYYRLGLMEYEQARLLQERLAQEIAGGMCEASLLLLEHPHTYTFGRRGALENLLWDAAELERRGIAVHWVDRGGDVTYHGPGQLVGYPLLPLGNRGLVPGSQEGALPKADYVGYVRRLEQALVGGLARLGVAGSVLPGLTGVWVAEPGSGTLAKIAAIGVKVDAQGVTRHGFALNVNPDMSYWDGIIGCGLKDHHSTCLAELLDPLPSMQQVMDALVASFGEIFGYQMVEGAPVLGAREAG